MGSCSRGASSAPSRRSARSRHLSDKAFDDLSSDSSAENGPVLVSCCLCKKKDPASRMKTFQGRSVHLSMCFPDVKAYRRCFNGNPDELAEFDNLLQGQPGQWRQKIVRFAQHRKQGRAAIKEGIINSKSGRPCKQIRASTSKIHSR